MTTSAGTDSCDNACPFCHPARERIVFENPLGGVRWVIDGSSYEIVLTPAA
jgi:hypothetical protein